MTVPSGGTLGSIEVLERLASDRDGELLLGRQPALGRRVELRRLSRDRAEARAARERFECAARFGATVLHPNLKSVLDCFALRGDHYLVSEHVDGPDLEQVLQGARRVPLPIAVLIARAVSCALEALHERHVAHLEVSPEQVRVSRSGEVKLGGFGGARRFGEDAEPQLYAPSECTAPERLQGGPAEPASDVYALGGILERLLARSEGGPRRRSLMRVTRRCLDPVPDRRPSAREVRERLEEHPSQRPAEGTATIAAWLWEAGLVRGAAAEEEARTRPPRVTGFVPLAQAGTAVGVGAAVALSLYLLVGGGGPPDAPLTASRAAAPPDPPPVSAPGPSSGGPSRASGAPGRVRFVVHPWAEIHVGGHPPLLTPRAAPLELPPGRHEVRLRHPSYGEVVRTVDIEAGGSTVLRHVFTPAEAPR